MRLADLTTQQRAALLASVALLRRPAPVARARRVVVPPRRWDTDSREAEVARRLRAYLLACLERALAAMPSATATVTSDLADRVVAAAIDGQAADALARHLGDHLGDVHQRAAREGVALVYTHRALRKADPAPPPTGPGTYDGALNQANARGVTWSKQHSAKLVTNINDTTRDAIRAAVTKAIEDGATVQQLTKTLKQGNGFSTYRARMIARTELAFANVEGNLAAYRAAGIKAKEWAVAQDEYCDACDDLDGTVVGLDDVFAAGKHKPVQGPPLHPNCRCDLLPVLDVDEAGLPTVPVEQAKPTGPQKNPAKPKAPPKAPEPPPPPAPPPTPAPVVGKPKDGPGTLQMPDGTTLKVPGPKPHQVFSHYDGNGDPVYVYNPAWKVGHGWKTPDPKEPGFVKDPTTGALTPVASKPTGTQHDGYTPEGKPIWVKPPPKPVDPGAAYDPVNHPLPSMPGELDDVVNATAHGSTSKTAAASYHTQQVDFWAKVFEGVARTPKTGRKMIDYAHSYQGGGYQGLNGWLRTGTTDNKYQREFAESMDAMFAQHAVPVGRAGKDLTVYRGGWMGRESLAKLLKPGTIFRDPAFVSSSLSYGKARQFLSGSEGMMFVIRVPAGTRAFYLPRSLTDTGGAYEWEILLNRGGRFRVDKVTVAEGDAHGRAVVECTWLGNEPQPFPGSTTKLAKAASSARVSARRGDRFTWRLSDLTIE